MPCHSPVSLRLLASLVHVPGGAHEVVPLGQVDVHRPVALLDRLLDGELEGHLHDGVDHALVQLGHVGDGANVVRLQGGCRKMGRSQADSSIVDMRSNLTFVRRVHVPSREEVSRVVLGHVDAARDVHDDGVVAHLPVLAEPDGEPALVRLLRAVVHLDVSIFVSSRQPIRQEEGAVLQWQIGLELTCLQKSWYCSLRL